MKKIYSLIVLCCFGLLEISAQNIGSLPTNINVDELSDAQIRTYWEKAQAEGYSLADLETMATLKKIPQEQIAKLKQRIMQLPASEKSTSKNTETEVSSQTTSENDIFGLTGEEDKNNIKKNKIFGYDFFRNPNISFTPNLNMPTPENYIIGTGDELLVEVWGATENKTTQKVDNQGNINIDLVGKVRVGGLSFSQAKERIKSALRQIYSGISAPDGSYAKIYTGVSIANVRTVKVNIIGEVTAPGTYSLSALSTVLNALYACGGPSETGSFRNIKLIRNGKSVATFDIYEFLLTGSQEGNTNLNDQDVILVSPYENRVEVNGCVKREGIFEIKEGENLSDLARYFGGFKPNAYKDNLVVERITGAKLEVKEIPFATASNFLIKNGDKLTVHELSKVYHNRLSISGAVYQPGNYAFSEGVSVSDLIDRAAGILENAYVDRALLFRLNDGVDKEAINFSVRNILNKKENILLKPNDSIYIFYKDSIAENHSLRIEGAVKSPKKIPYMKGMKVEDLIVMADGFTEGADPTTIQISRQINDGNFNKISEIFNVSLSPDLQVSSNSIELMPDDIVTVRLIKGYTQQQLVRIDGEVQFPGIYALETKQDRISNLISRAGGFSPYAYLKGATLLRKKTDVGEKEQAKQLEQLKDDGLVTSITEEKGEYLVGINLEKIIKDGKLYQNLILKEGDVLIIPSEKQTIEVKGEVLLPSMVRYEKGKSAKAYINSSGGFTNNAKRNSVYVMYANGEVRGTKNFLFFNSYPKIESGAVIVVPEKPERKGLSATETVSITTALTTLAILIYNTFVK